MAGGSALSVSNSLNSGYSNGRITWYVAVSCMVAALGGAIFGYDAGVTGGVTSMDGFLKKFFLEVYGKMRRHKDVSNYCLFDSQLLTLFTSSLYISGLVASMLASSTTRAYGRKPSLLVGGISVLVGSALCGMAINIYMLLLGRLIIGFGVGFANQSIPMYLAELAPAKYRGAFNNGFTFSISIGVQLATLVNLGTEKIKGGWGWRVSIAFTAVPAFILTLGALFLPETPNSIIQTTNDQKRAEVVLQKIRGTSDIQAEFNDIVQASLKARIMTNPFEKLLLQAKYRPQLIMAIIIPFFQQMTGVNAVGLYAPLLFRVAGLGESASLLAASINAIVGMAAAVISMLTVERFGRRKLFFLGGALMFGSFFTTGSIMAAKLGDHGSLSKGYALLVLTCLAIFIIGYCLSWGPLGFLVPSEIFQLEVRSAGQGITVASCFICSGVMAQTLLAILCRLKAGIFFFFAGWIVMMTGYVYFLLPETKNVPIEKMDRVWQEHWFWSKIICKGDNVNNDIIQPTSV